MLCLNSLHGNKAGDGKPSQLTAVEVDNIVLEVQRNSIDTLYVLSHHPALSYELQSEAPFDEDKEDDDGWNRSHIWSVGGNIFDRLSNRTIVSNKVLWFSGDVHRTEFTVVNQKKILITTGSLNSQETASTNVRPQAKLINTDDLDFCNQYEYALSGHHGKGNVGAWEEKKKEASVHRAGGSQEFSTMNRSISLEPLSDEEKDECNSEVKVNYHRLILPDEGDESIEDKIYKTIVGRKLVKFGRFDTSEKLVSLNWVLTTPLMDHRNIYQGVIQSFKHEIEKTVEDKTQALLVGIDHWGSILAARLGASVNMRSCCVAVRGANELYDLREVVNPELKKVVQGKKKIFLLVDVVATGDSILKLINSFDSSSEYYVLSVICDPLQDRSAGFIVA